MNDVPDRKSRLVAWNVLVRQSEYLAGLAESLRYDDNNPDAAKAIREKIIQIRNIADWLREVGED